MGRMSLPFDRRKVTVALLVAAALCYVAWIYFFSPPDLRYLSSPLFSAIPSTTCFALLGDGGWDSCLDPVSFDPCVVYQVGIPHTHKEQFGESWERRGCQVHVFLEKACTTHCDPNIHYHVGDGTFSDPAQVLARAIPNLGHKYVDIIKVDCNGCEWDFIQKNQGALEYVLAHAGQVLIQAHVSKDYGFGNDESVMKAITSVEVFEKNHFMLFSSRQLSGGWFGPSAHPRFLFESGAPIFHLSLKRQEPLRYTDADKQGLPVVYALMITGKVKERIPLATLAVENFAAQTYPNKKLIVVVNTPHLPSFESLDKANIPYQVVNAPASDKLAELRTASLNAIEHGALWVQWDDDDLKHEEFMQIMYNCLRLHPNAGACVCGQQLRYTVADDAGLVHDNRDVRKGIEGTIAARKGVGSPSEYGGKKSKGEDTVFIKKIPVIINLNNDPCMYLRIIHSHNTWGRDHFKKGTRHVIKGVSEQCVDYLYSKLPYIVSAAKGLDSPSDS